MFKIFLSSPRALLKSAAYTPLAVPAVQPEPVIEKAPPVKPIAKGVSGLQWEQERWLVTLLVFIGGIAHGLNMFNSPSLDFLDDEGIYVSQAWSVLHLHQLTPYTYFYDHSPVGWLITALWVGLTGGFRTFGTGMSAESGRVLMLIMHLAMIVFVYRIGRKLGCNPAAAAFATLIFSLSPLALFYQRYLLLDNIMLFWVLLSLDLLLDGWGRLSRVVMSGICFGIGLLCKETALFLLPAMLFIVFQQRFKHQGRFAIGAWVVPTVAVVIWYPFYAILKGEFFQADQKLHLLFFTFDTGSNHVSLLWSLGWQATRDGGGMYNLQNMFWQLMRSDWVPRDAFLILGGGAAVLCNLLLGLRNRATLAIGLLGFFPLYYLGRGGVVINYYILFAIPFLALNIAVALMPLLKRLPARLNIALVGISLAGLIAGYWLTGLEQPLYFTNPSNAGRQAVSWIKQNVPANSRIITRDDVWTDLREDGLGGPPFPNLYSHWKVSGDPAIKDGVFHDDWHYVDYLIMSPGLQEVFQSTGNDVGLAAYQHAHKVKEWSSDGAELELWQVDKTDQPKSQQVSTTTP